MNKYIIYLVVLILSFSVWACINEIGLNVDTEQRTLVVDGFVTDSLGDFQLKLFQSSVIGIGNDNILDPIPGASVALIDSDGQSYPYSESADGTYKLSSFKALRGKAYHIDIQLPNGKHYQSKPATIRSSSVIDDISYSIEEVSYRNNIGVFVTEEVISLKIVTDVSTAPQPPYLRWRVEGEYQLQEAYPGALNPRRCYIKSNLDLNDIRLFDASELSKGLLYDQVIAETSYNFRFADQFCFHISQYSISEDEFNYWNNIKEVIDIDGGLFDPPPGTVIGNISNVDDPDEVAVGYFSVSSVFFIRAFINSNELNFFVAPKCGTRGSRVIPFGCNDCLDINNSTLERPPYWEF